MSFDQVTSNLLVRVYPDDISVDTHEPRLTPSEKPAGDQLWKAGPATATGHALWPPLRTLMRLWIGRRVTAPMRTMEERSFTRTNAMACDWDMRSDSLLIRFAMSRVLIARMAGKPSL
jgi:hypothetical protein